MRDFYRNKRVFVTGHTGFKGCWLCTLLAMYPAGYGGSGNNRICLAARYNAKPLGT